MRYSTSDRDVILTHVRLNTSNLSKAFADAAVQLGRNPRSVAQHYYRYLRPEMLRMYTTKKDGHLLTNVKNAPRVNPTARMATLTRQLAARQSQPRQTARCVSETARIKAAIRTLASQI